MRKSERLSGKKAVSLLFEEGRSFYVPPLRIIYRFEDRGASPASMLVSVPKRIFKRAVDRNLLKRRIREVYRQNKTELYGKLEAENKIMHLGIQYNKKEILSYTEIETAFKNALGQLMAELFPA